MVVFLPQLTIIDIEIPVPVRQRALKTGQRGYVQAPERDAQMRKPIF
jgi:hypothetical protein